MRPPAPEPDWIGGLPVPSPGDVEDGYYIFNGLATNSSSKTVLNVVVNVESETLSIVWYQNSGHPWYYDETEDALKTWSFGTTGLLEDIMSKLSSYEFTAGTHVSIQTLSKDEIVGKFLPDE